MSTLEKRIAEARLYIPLTYVAAARQLGISPRDYLLKREAGEVWCSVGQHWVKAEDIPSYSRSRCLACNRVEAKKRYYERKEKIAKALLDARRQLGGAEEIGEKIDRVWSEE